MSKTEKKKILFYLSLCVALLGATLLFLYFMNPDEIHLLRNGVVPTVMGAVGMATSALVKST